jgi:hypothetical protein
VLEDVEALAQGAVAPEVLALALAPLVALDVLDVDRLEAQPRLPAHVHALEAEGHPLALGERVADDQREEATGPEESPGVVDGGAEAREEVVEGRGVGEVARVVAEGDNVVVGRVQDDAIGPLGARTRESRSDPLEGCRLGRVADEDLGRDPVLVARLGDALARARGDVL